MAKTTFIQCPICRRQLVVVSAKETKKERLAEHAKLCIHSRYAKLEAENKDLRERINLAIGGIDALEHLNGELCREDVAAIKETLQQKGGKGK